MFGFDDEFKHIAKYMDIYQLLLENGHMQLDEIKKGLIDKGVAETSARRNSSDFWYSDSRLIWTDSRERIYLDQGSLNDFIYELADALKVVIYGKALVDDMNAEHEEQKEALVIRIRELSVESSTNLNHCNKHYKDLMRAQTKIADLKHELEKVNDRAVLLSGDLVLVRKELEEMTDSPWRMFKGFIKAIWNKVIYRERSAEDGGE